MLRNKIPARRNIGIDKDPKVISEWHSRYPEMCELVHADAIDYLLSHKYDGNELIYADPPYLRSTRRRSKVYTHDYVTSDHEELLATLQKLPCMVMLSGYDSELYNDSLLGWHKATFQAKTHTDVRQECVWLNFSPSRQLHDTSHLGMNFRERQTIKRRQQRLRDRIEKLNPIERSELIRWLTEKQVSDSREGI